VPCAFLEIVWLTTLALKNLQLGGDQFFYLTGLQSDEFEPMGFESSENKL